jgi:hypothetical protein
MKTYKFYTLLFALLFSCAILVGQTASAQCKLVKLDESGNIVGTIPVSCDFPVFIDTGDPVTDNANYDLAKQNWVDMHPGDYAAICEGFSYMSVLLVDLMNMPEAKRAVIEADPETYHIDN